jgi:hypothetical protein
MLAPGCGRAWLLFCPSARPVCAAGRNIKNIKDKLPQSGEKRESAFGFQGSTVFFLEAEHKKNNDADDPYPGNDVPNEKISGAG